MRQVVEDQAARKRPLQRRGGKRPKQAKPQRQCMKAKRGRELKLPTLLIKLRRARRAKRRRQCMRGKRGRELKLPTLLIKLRRARRAKPKLRDKQPKRMKGKQLN